MAIRELTQVPVNATGWEIEVRVIRAAEKQRDTPNGRVREPKMRNGIQGIELEVLVWWPELDEERRAKLTTYQADPPKLNRRDLIRVRGQLFAAAWSANGSSGLWFDAPEGIELAAKPAQTKAAVQ